MIGKVLFGLVIVIFLGSSNLVFAETYCLGGNPCPGLTSDFDLFIEMCGEGYNSSDFGNLVAFNAQVCPPIEGFRVATCGDSPGLLVHNANFGITFNSDYFGEAFCIVSTLDEDFDGVRGVSLNQFELPRLSKNTLGDDTCSRTVSSYGGVVSLRDSHAFGDSRGANRVAIGVSGNSVFSQVDILCVEELFLEHDVTHANSYEVGSFARTAHSISGNLPLDLIGAHLEIWYLNANPLDVQYPSFCQGVQDGAHYRLRCDITDSDEFFISPRFSGSDFVEVEYNLYYGSEAISDNRVSSETISLDFSGEISDEGDVNQTILFTLSDYSFKPFSDLAYGDVLKFAQAMCPQNTPSAELIIRNANLRQSCTFYTNDIRNGEVFFNFENPNLQRSGDLCMSPFEITRSGRYDITLNCNSGALCSGPCFNPISPVPGNFSGWREFLVLGKSMFSFFNQNSIPDCVCNAGGRLVPIQLFSDSVPIHVADISERAFVTIDFVNPSSNSVNIQKGGFYHFELELTCNRQGGCLDLEVYLDP